MTKNWSFAKITDILQKKIEFSDRISKSLSRQNLGCPSPYFDRQKVQQIWTEFSIY